MFHAKAVPRLPAVLVVGRHALGLSGARQAMLAGNRRELDFPRGCRGRAWAQRSEGRLRHSGQVFAVVARAGVFASFFPRLLTPRLEGAGSFTWQASRVPGRHSRQWQAHPMYCPLGLAKKMSAPLLRVWE